MNDKEWIKEQYLPQLSGKILYVGVMQNYDLHPFPITPESFETMDIDSGISKGISPYKHHTGDFLDFENEYKYDHISLHGLWGDNKMEEGKTPRGLLYYNDGVNNPTPTQINMTHMIIKMINKAHNMLNKGGTLQLGPNSNTNMKKNQLTHPLYMDSIYDYLKDNHYSELFREYGGESSYVGNFNHIFWGRKLNDKKINYTNDNLWDINTHTIKTIGLLKQ
jgi:hypothetical protein